MSGWRHTAFGCLCTVAWLGAPRPSMAQLPANAPWSTIASAHFRVTYADGLEELARAAAASAERAHAALRYVVAAPPSGTIDIVLTDNVDYSNGYATPFPSNRVVIFAKPPVDVLELQYTRDWIDLVVTHELAHVFHVDQSGSVGRFIRTVFGRVPAPWPVFPVLGTPLWSLEGLAVRAESGIAGLGRVHGSYNEMIVRTAALEAEIDDIHRLGSTTPVWPGGQRYYIYGSLFTDYLARRYGPDAVARIVRTTAGVIIPPPLWFGHVARRAIGTSFQDAYADWRRELHLRYDSLARQLRAAGLTESERLTTHGRIALYPRFSPDSRRIAYMSSDGRAEPHTIVIDARTGASEWTHRRNDVAPAAWQSDSSLLTSDLQYTERFRIFSDLYVVRDGDRDRLTHAARLQEPDVEQTTGRIVAVQNGAGTNRLVLVDPATGEHRAITPFEPEVHWALPRWAPAGHRIAVSRWQAGGRYDIVVMDTLGSVELEVTDGVGINSGAAWSPDGRWLVFASDRTGISNLYAADVITAANQPNGLDQPHAVLRQITHVLTGAFYPDVSPDGQSLAFTAYHHDGFSIERMPFDSTHWREPQPAVLEQLSEQRPAYHTQISPAEFSAAIGAARVRADTIAGPTGPYQPLRHAKPFFWLPVVESHADDSYFGIFSFGSDLVGRHDWSVRFAGAPGSGRTVGDVSYTYRGLPSIRPLRVHPTIALSFDRDWDEIDRIDSLGVHLDEREDVGAVALGLTHLRWRHSMNLTLAGELVRRSRYLLNAPQNLRIIDPNDDLLGARATATLASYVTPAMSISRENGVILQVSARTRSDRDPRVVQTSTGTRTIDNSYDELTSWNAAYLALPLAGFARHALAGRFSLLYRDGPGASTSGIGEASGTGFGISDFFNGLGGSSRLLPVRGFAADARRGTRAWTASAEYRFPLALVLRSLAPLPIYFDRLAGSLFTDAGHAWCDPSIATSFRSCISTSPWDPPLLSAGAELTAYLSFWGAGVPLRASFGVPLQGGSGVRLHLLAGASF